MADETFGIGVIGAAAIAKKNARAISMTRNGVGELCTHANQTRTPEVTLLVDCVRCRSHSSMMLSPTHRES